MEKHPQKYEMGQPVVILQSERFTIREFVPQDAPSLAKYANNRKIWANVRDQFPHPYSLENAQEFIRMINERQPANAFAILVGGEAVGGIGVHPQEDVYRYSAELGYWLGEPFWGKGLMTDIVKGVVAEAFKRFNIWRIYAGVFSSNPASMRVLEKAGFQKEGVRRAASFKDGKVLDEVMYGLLKEDFFLSLGHEKDPHRQQG